MIDVTGTPESQAAKPGRHRARVVALGASSLVIALVGGKFSFDLLGGMPWGICYEERAFLGESSAYVHAHLWIAGSAWVAFGSLYLFTYPPVRAWLRTAIAAAVGLLFVGSLTVLYGGLLSACQ